MKSNLSVILFFMLNAACTGNHPQAQTNSATDQKVGGRCEGCEAIYESPVPFAKLIYADTLEDFRRGNVLLEISGHIFKIDGKTPAPGVVFYIYHTDHTGVYPVRGNEKGWARRHGYLRGWVKTNEKGEYKFYTAKPAPYPGRKNPAHIHGVVKEPGLNEYYIGEYLFDGDPLLTTEAKKSTTEPGGNGVVKLTKSGDRLIVQRDIVLGRNVANYPTARYTPEHESGLALGADCPAFDPYHVSGPDKNSKACPMCKYGRGQGMMVWWNESSLDPLAPLLTQLENEIQISGYDKLRVFVMYMNKERKRIPDVQRYLQAFVRQYHLNKLAVTYIPSPDDGGTAGLYQINGKVSNTILIYHGRKIVDKHIDFDPSLGMGPLLANLNL
ncbi:MAG TPA: hypothetical protein VM012_11975 [Flavitalea sp.]|nr:hypothetical protein [Flavitalea sp.]